MPAFDESRGMSQEEAAEQLLPGVPEFMIEFGEVVHLSAKVLEQALTAASIMSNYSNLLGDILAVGLANGREILEKQRNEKADEAVQLLLKTEYPLEVAYACANGMSESYAEMTEEKQDIPSVDILVSMTAIWHALALVIAPVLKEINVQRGICGLCGGDPRDENHMDVLLSMGPTKAENEAEGEAEQAEETKEDTDI